MLGAVLPGLAGLANKKMIYFVLCTTNLRITTPSASGSLVGYCIYGVLSPGLLNLVATREHEVTR